jgi:alpha-amylase/alpha-mannosidase (GH57 family)
MNRGEQLLLVGVWLLASCSPSSATPPSEPTAGLDVEPAGDVLYLNLVWHQHQPLYYKNADGLYTRPWVRVHATKDYFDMASLVSSYPDVHVTFNLTPVLLRQLEDFAEGNARDVYWALAEKPATSLAEEDKRFILERFFDANWTNIIGRYPRYRELLDQRGGADPQAIEAALGTFSEQDYRDLQVWFNLAWFDPTFLDDQPLLALVEKGRNFGEEDKMILFHQVREVIRRVISLHRDLQDSGQIEVITSPYAHPILPLLYNTKLALVGNSSADMPGRFSYPNDAIAQLGRSVEMYQELFGRPPAGLWPSEGAVAEDIIPLVANAGFTWMASGEQVLAKSLGIGSFTRDAQDTVQEADQLYRPYFVQGERGDPVLMVFRDLRLSDLIGFEYSQTPGPEAADDLLLRLENIRLQLQEEGATEPHLVSIILDGENAWEHYPNDGIEFLRALYDGLSESTTIETITPSAYLERFPEQRELETLFPGAWFSPNYDTWIGEPEETAAWNYLLETREDLAAYDLYGRKTAPSDEALQAALDSMYLAEGSDWFWWYGADQSSGNDEYFDEGFRALLRQVYESLGEGPPVLLQVPIVARTPIEPDHGLTGTMTATIDGVVSPPKEWDAAATYTSVGGVQARAEDVARTMAVGIDADNLHLRLDVPDGWTSVPEARASIYLSSPRLGLTQPFRRGSTELVGFGATSMVDVSLDGGRAVATIYLPSPDGWSTPSAPGVASSAVSGSVLEVRVPLTILGEIEPGDNVRLVSVVSSGERDLQTLPADGPASITLPDLGLTTLLLEIADPSGDDHGPGSYTYPTDGVFEPQIFDLSAFAVGYDENNIVFRFDFFGPIPNPWDSPNGLAVQTLDVYIDTDPGESTGLTMLLPGRNAALESGFGWDYAVWAEGWTPQFIAASDDGSPKPDSSVSFKVIVDAAQRHVSLRVPRAAFGEGDPSTWAFAAAVLSQDGFPSAGVWRVRDILMEAEQWRLGRAADDTNHTRIIDLAWPSDAGASQETMLSGYSASQQPVGELGPESFARLPMLRP